MKRDAIISLCIALPVANLPFWQWRSPAEMLLMAGLFWQVAFVAVEGGKVIAAAWSGKIKTASTMVCFILLMLPVPEWTVTACWIVVLATTVYSGIEYFVKNASVFK